MLNKEELKHINSLDKEWFYEQYLNIDIAHKDYDKITKRQMLEAIYNDILDSKYYLNRSILKEDVVFLKEHISNNKTKIIKNNKNYANISRLANSLLLFKYDYFSNEYIIPTKVFEIFENYDLSLLDEELDKFYYFLHGLLLVRGKIKGKEARRIYRSDKANKINITFEEGAGYMMGSVLNLDELTYEMVDILVKRDNYFEYHINELYKSTKYSLKEYSNYGRYGLNIDEPNNNQLYKIISKQINSDFIYYFIENFLNHLQEQPGSVHRRTLQVLLNASNADFDKAMELYNELIRILPRWDFKGATHDSVKREDVIEFHKYVNSLNDYTGGDVCDCGSGLHYDDCCGNRVKLLANKAVLEEGKAKLLYSIISELIIYANAKYQKLEFNDFESFFTKIKQNDYIELKDLAFEDEEVINNFILDYEEGFTKDDYEIIEGIKNSYKNYFYALDYVDNKLVIYDENHKVKIILSGIVSPLSDGISSSLFPFVIETRLIPLKDRITYDVFINNLSVKIGPNIKERILEDSQDVKVITNIVEFKKAIFHRI